MTHEQELHVAPPRGRNLQLSDKSHATSGGSDATVSATTDLKALADKYLQRKQCNQPCNRDATEALESMQLSGAPEASKVASVAPGPLGEIEIIVRSLRDEVGRDLGEELTTAIQRAMRPLDRASRADLCAAIDDAFATTESTREARQKALALLPDDHTVSPGTPAEWAEWIAEQCPLLPDDKHFIEHRLAIAKAQHREARARWYVQAWARAAEAEPKSHRKDNAGRRAANITLMGSRAS